MTDTKLGLAPILVLGWGNPSRGDDALGPAFIERAEALSTRLGAPRIEWLTDFQLQVEHALDLDGRSRVLFVDASLDCAVPFEARTIQAQASHSLTSHALTPQAVLQVYAQVNKRPAPTCTLLAIRAYRFELGEAIGKQAQEHLALALSWFPHWLADQPVADPAACTS